MRKLAFRRDEKGCCEKYVFPGGYPVYYVCADGGILCPDCVDSEQALIDVADEHDRQWMVIGQEINYEDDQLYCDNCNKRIKPAYSD